MNPAADRFSVMRLLQAIRAVGIFPSLTSGVVMGLMKTFFAISFASLIFAGPLETYLPVGIGLALFGTMIVLLVLALFNSQPWVMSIVQDVPSVQLAVIAGYLTSTLPTGALYPTVLAVIALASLLTGLLLVLLGLLKLGKIIRYFPYPVVGGFLAATGWLLVVGSIQIMSGAPLTLATLGQYLQPGSLLLWLPGVATGLVLLYVANHARHPMALPGSIAAIFLLFYAALLALGVPLERAAQLGFFFHGSTQVSWQPLSLEIFQQANWQAILQVSGNLAVLMGMTLVGLLMNVSAIEVVSNNEADLNHDLRVVGFANVLSGLGGGMIGYHALGPTVISRRISGKSRLAPLFAAGVILLIIFFGSGALSYVPRFLVGGMLLLIGLDFLYDWLFKSWQRFSAREYAIVLGILVIIVLTDFLTGVMAGILATVVIFAVSYSQTRVVLRAYTVSEVRSMLVRSPEENHCLQNKGDLAHVLELQGYLFFGTANKLVEDVKYRLASPGGQALKFLMVDFRQVTGIDSSALLSFRKISQLLEEHSARLVLSEINDDICRRLQLNEAGGHADAIRTFAHLDKGLEWLEDQVLTLCDARDPRPVAGPNGCPLPEELRMIPETYFSMHKVAPGEVIIRKGDPADCLYFLLDGVVSVYLDPDHLHAKRVSAFSVGSVMGEVGLYLNQPRTAFVIADEPTWLMVISREAIQQMRCAEPALALALEDFIIRQMVARLLQYDKSIAALRR